MTARLLAVTFDARDPGRQADFWARLLERDAEPHAGGMLVPGDRTQVGLRFAPTDEPLDDGTSRTLLHLHLTSEGLGQQAVVDRVLALGGSHLDVGQRPEEGHVVLADPDGNPLCVIEEDNTFLAGCGFLGEVACDGARDVGVFWSRALDWPLVWDQDEETAVQAPAGGTKVAWGGPPDDPKAGRMRQRFDVVADDVAAEVDRLVGLGAQRLPDVDGVVELADPGGNEFAVREH